MPNNTPAPRTEAEFAQATQAAKEIVRICLTLQGDAAAAALRDSYLKIGDLLPLATGSALLALGGSLRDILRDHPNIQIIGLDLSTPE